MKGNRQGVALSRGSLDGDSGYLHLLSFSCNRDLCNRRAIISRQRPRIKYDEL